MRPLNPTTPVEDVTTLSPWSGAFRRIHVHRDVGRMRRRPREFVSRRLRPLFCRQIPQNENVDVWTWIICGLTVFASYTKIAATRLVRTRSLLSLTQGQMGNKIFLSTEELISVRTCSKLSFKFPNGHAQLAFILICQRISMSFQRATIFKDVKKQTRAEAKNLLNCWLCRNDSRFKKPLTHCTKYCTQLWALYITRTSIHVNQTF